MKNMKFRVRDEQHSKEIQDALFAAGYKWTVKGSYYKTEEAFLYSYSDGCICYDCREYYFDDHQNKEHFVLGGNIYPQGSTSIGSLLKSAKLPIGLRPKCICDALRKQEILEAITRYVEDAKKVPQEWLEEFSELNGRTK